MQTLVPQASESSRSDETLTLRGLTTSAKKRKKRHGHSPRKLVINKYRGSRTHASALKRSLPPRHYPTSSVEEKYPLAAEILVDVEIPETSSPGHSARTAFQLLERCKVKKIQRTFSLTLTSLRSPDCVCHDGNDLEKQRRSWRSRAN